jgi:hypothetical protein
MKADQSFHFCFLGRDPAALCYAFCIMVLNSLPVQHSADQLIRNIRRHIVELSLLGLVTAFYIAFSYYRISRIQDAVSEHMVLDFKQTLLNQARQRIDRNNALLVTYLLDGGASPPFLNPRAELAQMPDWSGSQQDPVLKDTFALEEQWYSKVAQPLIEERKAVDEHRSSFEELITRYRNMETVRQHLDWKAETASTEILGRSLNGLRQFPGRISSKMIFEYGVAALLVMGWLLSVVGILTNLRKLQAVTDEQGSYVTAHR